MSILAFVLFVRGSMFQYIRNRIMNVDGSNPSICLMSDHGIAFKNRNPLKTQVWALLVVFHPLFKVELPPLYALLTLLLIAQAIAIFWWEYLSSPLNNLFKYSVCFLKPLYSTRSKYLRVHWGNLKIVVRKWCLWSWAENCFLSP